MTLFHQQDGPAYYSEHDIEKAHWLRELMRERVIAPGAIDIRSIEDVTPTELAGFVQHHFFAGIGIWSYAARLAGWPDDQPIRTLSCPCQPFSAAGQGAAFDDSRHLWPAACWHIEFGASCPTFGEQVASSDGLAWLDLVSADLEAAGYSIGALDLCAAGVGAPHNRSRLYFAADRSVDELDDSICDGRGARGFGDHGWDERKQLTATRGSHQLEDAGLTQVRRSAGAGETNGGWPRGEVAGSSATGILAHAYRPGSQAERGYVGGETLPGEHGESRMLADSNGAERRPLHVNRQDGADWSDGGRQKAHGIAGTYSQVHHPAPGPVNGFWRDADWLHCRPEPCHPEGRWRPVESGSFPLAHGSAARVLRLRGYGDGIVASLAAAFIRAYREENGLSTVPFFPSTAVAECRKPLPFPITDCTIDRAETLLSVTDESTFSPPSVVGGAR